MGLKVYFLPLICFLNFLHFNFAYGSGWEKEYWQYLTWNSFEHCKWKLYTVAQARFNKDISRFYHIRLTENLAYKILPDLDLEVHYTFIYTKPLEPKSQFSKRHRLELEATSSLNLRQGINLKWRNRFEITKHEDNPRLRTAFRCQLRAILPLKNAGKLTEISCLDEVFYHFDVHKFTQNRIRPIELTFALTSKLTIKVFVMIRHFFTSNKWHRSLDFGSDVAF